MPRTLKIFIAFLAGLVVGETIPILYYIAATELGFFSWDGGGAMGAALLFGPVFAVTFAIVFAVIAARGKRARRLTRHINQPHHIPIHPLHTFEPQRRARAGEVGSAFAQHDRMQIDPVFVDQA
jgi:hypothetical protein